MIVGVRSAFRVAIRGVCWCSKCLPGWMGFFGCFLGWPQLELMKEISRSTVGQQRIKTFAERRRCGAVCIVACFAPTPTPPSPPPVLVRPLNQPTADPLCPLWAKTPPPRQAPMGNDDTPPLSRCTCCDCRARHTHCRKVKSVQETFQRQVFQEFNAQNPTGRYIMDLANADDRHTLKRWGGCSWID